MKYAKNQGGFTLLELLAAAIFIGITFISVSQIFIAVNTVNRRSSALNDAKFAAQTKIEQYRSTAYSSIPTGSPAETFTSSLPASLRSPKTATSTITEVQAGLKQVDIFISYTDYDGTTKQVQMSTYITQRGIDR